MNTASAITVENSAQSPLLRLPPEIRMKIYTLVMNWEEIHLASHDESERTYAFHCKGKHDDTWLKKVKTRTSGHFLVKNALLRYEHCFDGHLGLVRPVSQVRQSLNILETCRQIYLEAANLPFQLKKLFVHSSPALNRLLRGLTAEQARGIKSLVLIGADLHRLERDAVLKLGVLDSLTICLEVPNTRNRRLLIGFCEVATYNSHEYVDFGSEAWTCLRAHKVDCLVGVCSHIELQYSKGNPDLHYWQKLSSAREVARPIEQRIEGTSRIPHNTLHRYFSSSR